MSESPDTRVRLLDAALQCIDRWGLTKTSLEDIANQAGLSRATVYRYFPGGRDQVISETVSWEVGRFFARIGEEIAELPDLEAKLERGLVYGHQTIVEHRLLQQVLTSLALRGGSRLVTYLRLGEVKPPSRLPLGHA